MKITKKNFMPMALCILGTFAVSCLLAKLSEEAVTAIAPRIPTWIFGSPTVLSFMAIIFTLYDRILWRCPGAKLFKLNENPDLNGRWRGTICTSYDGHKLDVPAILEIKQTASEVSIRMYLKESSSKSVMAIFLETDEPFEKLTYEYQNNPRNDSKSELKTHWGVAHLDCYRDKNVLEGFYYTSPRDRGNYGTMKFEFLASKLKGRYDE